MVDTPTVKAETPTGNKLQLGAVIRTLREKTRPRLSQEKLGQVVFPGLAATRAQSKLAAIERGHRSLHASELATLQAELGVTDETLVAWMADRLAKSSQPGGAWGGRWTGHRAVYSEEMRTYIDLEEDSTRIRGVALWLMPDLLMCERYAEQSFAGRGGTTELRDAQVAAVLDRARLLDDQRRRVRFVLCESAVRRAPRGDRAVVRAQISHVIELSQRPNVAVQVVPFIQLRDSPDPELYDFTILDIAADPPAPPFRRVQIGAPGARRPLDKDADGVYEQCFADAERAGLRGDHARRFLAEISREYK